MYHEPVMLEEILTWLDPKEGKKFIDCTLGDGGHSIALLEKGSKVLGLDSSNSALERALNRIKGLGLSSLFTGVRENFNNLEETAKGFGFEQVNGVLFDLGYSSSQLEGIASGISFFGEQDLDMRLDDTLGVTAADLLNTLSEKQLAKFIFEYSGERYARRIANEIVNFRSVEKFHSTKQLVKVVESATPLGYEKGRISPATRTFQALRIAVNDELGNLTKALPQAARVLLPGGRMCILTYHSLEDKIVKKFGLSVQPKLTQLTQKPVGPSSLEVRKNVRSRSAKLRVYERV